MVLFNDWSARDIQKWEYVPLGPFLAKNFASSMSAWIVTLDALEPFRVAGPKQDPAVFPYLEYSGEKNIDINLEVLIQPDGADASTVCKSNYKHMYWNQNQQPTRSLSLAASTELQQHCTWLWRASPEVHAPTPSGDYLGVRHQMDGTWR